MQIILNHVFKNDTQKYNFAIMSLLRLEQGWLCQFKVTGCSIMFFCGIILRCGWSLKPTLSLDQLQQI